MLGKQTLNINFSQGLDTKTDPFQLQPGKFLSLKNSVFDKAGRLTKRNGYTPLPTLAGTESTSLTTFNGDLTAIGSSLYALSLGSSTWFNKGSILPVEVDTLSLLRSSSNQSHADAAIAPNNIVCTVFTESGPTYKYVIADSVTGQNIISPRVIPVSAGTITYSPRVFSLGRYFIILFNNLVSATYHLQYVAIDAYNPTVVNTEVDLSTLVTPTSEGSFDGVVTNNTLYIGWNGSDGGGAIRTTFLTSTLAQGNTVVYSSQSLDTISLTADTSGSTPVIWLSWIQNSTNRALTLSYSQTQVPVTSQQTVEAAITATNITSTAINGVVRIYYQITNTYSYNSVRTDYIKVNTVTQAGSVGTPVVLARSVGLASKAFLISGISYLLSVYSSPNQPTYFLLNQSGQVVSKLAYSNGDGYITTGLPGVSISGSTASIPYLIKDLLVAVNKENGSANGTAFYTQTGVNLAQFTIGTPKPLSVEIGKNLNFTGGFLWGYDGYLPTEQGFHLYPDNIVVTTSGAGGSITAQQYYYQVTYEWTDNQGNLFRSAPSVPFTITTIGATSTNTINVPTLRLTKKTANPVSIVIYRWSTAQQTFYQITSVTSPLQNNTAVDSVTFSDTLADSSIIGNTVLYTTGGVLENIAAPACNVVTLFQSRLFLVDSEDRDLLWYSKQVIEGTPVEMSDLLTIFVAPTTGAQGSTGPITALSALDDKLIVFKENAMYYIAGTGPDSTGANNQFTEPVFISSTVGCTNPRSIVFMPQGLLFQSDKGIWLLGRDLSTNYIGAPVESLTTGATVLSSENIPGTNQVRFTMDTGITLMYDYYYGQWGTFTNIPAISSTLFEDLHTYLDSFGRVFQETLGMYLDNTSPVLMSFTTGWINLAGVQGLERFYQMYLLGQYLSPFKLNTQFAFDYNPSVIQSTVVTNANSSAAWGGEQLWGSGEFWGGPASVFEARIFPQIQKCESFQITIDEIFDSSVGQTAGAGLTLSGMNLVVGMKKGYRTSTAARSFG